MITDIDNDSASVFEYTTKNIVPMQSSTGSSSESSDETCKNGIRDNLAKVETFQVKQSRALVLAILILSATAICVVVYYISKKTEYEQFQSQYDGIASKVFGSFEMLTSRMSAINSLSTAATIVGFNRTSNTTIWPFVTLPSFEQRATTILTLSHALDVSLYPKVTPQNRERWETYCVGNDNYWM